MNVMNNMSTEQYNQKMSWSKNSKSLEALYWGVILVWAGLVFGAESIGKLPQFGQADAWSWIFLGAGVLVFLANLYRLTSPDVLNPSTWDWSWSGIFLILGLGGFTALNLSWPLILILVGGVTLVKALGSS